MKRLIDWVLASPVRFYLSGLLFLLPIIGVLDYFFLQNWGDVLVEAHGLAFDLLVLGILLTIYSSVKDKRDLEERIVKERQLKIDRYLEEIDDYRTWNDKEAMYRIAGNIKRLNELRVTNINLFNCKLKNVQLRSINLSESYLTGSDFGNGYLRGALLNGAKLIGAYFGDSNLRGASLQNCDLERCKFQRSNLQGADLRNSKCERALFWDANLQNADLRNCNLSGAKFGGAILCSVRFEGATNLTVEQLLEAKSLKSIRISADLLDEIKRLKPELLEV